MKLILFFSIFFILASCAHTSRAVRESAQVEDMRGKLGFKKITLPGLNYYYLASTHPEDPLILYIGGSGCNSAFWKDTSGNLISGPPGLLGNEFHGRVAIVTVDKPGVQPYDRDVSDKPGATGCRSEFLRDFDLNSWEKTLKTALDDVVTRQRLTPKKIISMGHSEGGEMALRVAASPEVTHTIAMSGWPGPVLSISIQRALFGANGDPKKEADWMKDVLTQYREAMARPASASNFLWGHTTRYWRSRDSVSLRDVVSRSKSKVLLVYGTKDPSSPSADGDSVVAELERAGRAYEYWRIAGADHIYGGRQQFDDQILKAAHWALDH